MAFVKRLSNGLRKRQVELSELFDSVPKAAHYSALSQAGSPVFYVSRNLKRGLWSHISFLDSFSRFLPHGDDDRNKAYNNWVRSHFAKNGDRSVFEAQGIRLEMPAGFPNAETIVTNDLREILLENRYSCMFPGGRLVNEGDVVLDCGANIGGFAIHAALGAPNVRVIAFEPEPMTYQALCHNVESNGLQSRVECLQLGVTDKIAEYGFQPNESCFTMHRLKDPKHALNAEQSAGGSGSVVRCVTIDKTMNDSGLERCDLIKMDIEGAEGVALAGAVETIRRYRPRLSIAAYHKPSDPYTLSTAVKEICEDYNIIVTSDGHLYAFL